MIALWLLVVATLLAASVAYDPNAVYAAVFVTLVLAIWRLRRWRHTVLARQPDGILAGGVGEFGGGAGGGAGGGCGGGGAGGGCGGGG